MIHATKDRCAALSHAMQDDLVRAQHYQELAEKMRETAKVEPDPKWRDQLLDLAAQYEKLAVQILARRNS